jgi:hypothetical protein
MHAKKAAAAVATSFILAVPFAAPAVAAQNTKQANQGNLISALNNVSVQIDRVNALNDLTITDVRVVNVEDVLNNNNVLNNSLNNNDVLTDFLNNSLNNNNVEIIKNVLNNNNVAIDDVVAINVLSGGDIVIFQQ